jgi:Dullard-like phosphatase family protein
MPLNNVNYNKNTTNINTYINNNYYKNDSGNKSYGYLNSGFNNNYIFESNNYNRNTCNNNGYFYGMKNHHFFITSNNNQNPLLNYNNNIPLRTYGNRPTGDLSCDTYEKTNYRVSPDIPKRYISNKNNKNLNSINTPTNITSKINFTYQNNSPHQNNKTITEKEQSINIEDLLVLEEKFNDIIIFLNKNRQMHNECFEFWNYYYNCSLFGRLEKLFKTGDNLNVQISMNHLLMSVMICYDYSFELNVLRGDYSILEDILKLNHKNLIIIYEHILSKISSESKSNIWVLKLHNLIDNFNKNEDNKDFDTYKGRLISSIEKIIYNSLELVQNIRTLLKNYKTERIEHLTSIFKKINDKTYEEINTFFINNILRTENLSGSVLASVFLKENQQFQTEPAPYIKTKNRKAYSLVLDLDETLIHFKVSNEDENEGVLQIRPGVVPFLEMVGQYYEMIVFTAATQDYGDLLIDNIEENNLYFEHRFYRQHTVIIGNDFVKDLRRIGRPLDKIIIVDNMPQNFRLQKENGINIKAFWGDDANDNVLEDLGKILINIAKEGGDLRNGLFKYRDEIIRKVTSNISKSNY